MLSMLYMKPPTNPNPNPGATISDNAYAQLQYVIDKSVTDAPGGVDAASSSFNFGKAVATVFFNLLFHAPGASQAGYHPTPGPYKFDDEPTHPVVLVPVDANNPDGPKRPFRQYHGPVKAPMYKLHMRYTLTSYIGDLVLWQDC
jgi:vanadium chloroperoxidase